MKKTLLKLGTVALGATLVLLLVLLSVIAGAASLGVTGGVFVGIAWVMGIVGVPTAKAVFLWFAALGAVIGGFRGVLFTASAFSGR